MATNRYLDLRGLETYHELEKEEIVKVDTKVGDISKLDTTAKTDLVSAINEVRNSVSAGGTDAAVTCDTTTTTEGYLKSYTIKQGSNVICTIDIPKDLFAVSGEVIVNPDGQPEGTYIKLVIENQADPIYINASSLIENYKAQENATQIQLTVDNTTREISAVIVAGSVGTTELVDGGVTTVKIADANVTLAKLAADVTDAIAEAKKAGTDAATAVSEAAERVEALETEIGDGFEAITNDEINALFS